MASPRIDLKNSNDSDWMRVALTLAARGLGRVAPNPAVGCVIVKDGHVLGRGWTQPGGRPHAETVALLQAGAQAMGATAYVSLEPCSHHGQTPPCAEALIEAGISRCVIAMTDPDSRVSGQGIAALQAAGVEVSEDVCGDEAATLNDGFVRRINEDRPLVTLKVATSLDGKVATARGDSKWITGADARRYGHLLRAQHDAIVTGIGTVLADDPELTCRLDGLEDRNPIRVVLDTSLRTPLDSKLVQTARTTPVWIVASPEVIADFGTPFTDAGVQLLAADETPQGDLDITSVMNVLAAQGMTRVLVECGPRLAASVLKANLADRLAWFRAPVALGGDALTAFDSLDAAKVTDGKRFAPVETLRLGEDVLETYCRTSY